MKNHKMENLKEKIMSANIEVHRKEAEYYDIIHKEIFNIYEQNRIRSSLSKITKDYDKKSTVLDVGAGTGNLTIKLLEEGFENITCLDLSKEMMNKLREKVKDYDHNIKFVVSDCDTFLKENNSTFDVVLMSSVLHHLPDYVESLELIKGALDKKAIVYITHEPLPKPKKISTTIKLLLKIDFIAYHIRYVFLKMIGKLKYLNLNHEFADFHTGDRAINSQQLKKTFVRDYKLKIEKYPVAKFAITAFLLDKLGYSNCFELVVIKNGSYKI